MDALERASELMKRAQKILESGEVDSNPAEKREVELVRDVAEFIINPKAVDDPLMDY